MAVFKHCRNCGKQLFAGETVCMGCGVPVGQGYNFCWNCGGKTDPKAVTCVNCGVGLIPENGQQRSQPYMQNTGKSKIAGGILGIFLGAFGVHNFYLGYQSKAVIQLVLGILGFVTFGVTSAISGIWGFVEGIMILTGSINTDGNGNPLSD